LQGWPGPIVFQGPAGRKDPAQKEGWVANGRQTEDKLWSRSSIK